MTILDARTSQGWDATTQGMADTLAAVAPYLAQKGKRDDEAWALYSRVIRALNEHNMDALPSWDSGIRKERD